MSDSQLTELLVKYQSLDNYYVQKLLSDFKNYKLAESNAPEQLRAMECSIHGGMIAVRQSGTEPAIIHDLEEYYQPRFRAIATATAPYTDMDDADVEQQLLAVPVPLPVHVAQPPQNRGNICWFVFWVFCVAGFIAAIILIKIIVGGGSL